MVLKKILAALSVMIALFIIAEVNVKAASDTISVKLSNYIGDENYLSFSLSGDFNVKGEKITLKDGAQYTIKVLNKNELGLYDESDRKIAEFKDSFIIASDRYATKNVHKIYGKSTKQYLGDMEYIIEDGEYIRPININIPFEDYLKGVVPLEMPASWNIDAVKSQAIAARTYSQSKKGTTVPDTQSFQVYGGYDWHPNSTQAIEQTKGEILTYNSRPISAVYSSSNGGYTESNANVWGSSALNYLQSKKDNYDPKNPWSITVNNEEINTRVLDLKNPSKWWNNVKEKNTGVTTSIKNWLYSQNQYKNTEIKIVGIPTLSFDDKNRSTRSTNATMTVEFFVKNKSNNTYRMKNGVIERVTVTHKAKATDMRSILGNGNVKSTLVTNSVTNGHMRLGGQDRFDVAVNVSRQGWNRANTVVLANWEAYGDALAATPLAYKYNGPLLLTKAESITPRTKDEIKRLGAKKVIIVGGPISVSNKIVGQLKDMGISVERISGQNRMEVAENIAKKMGEASKVVVADGFNFPDALSIAPWAARNGYPILLTNNKHNITKVTQSIIDKWNVNETVISGGPLSVSNEVYKNVPNPTRFGGNHRYDVSANIANKYFGHQNKAFVTKGTIFADALTGSVLAAKHNAPILLLKDTSMASVIEGSIESNGFDSFTILGGPLSVLPKVADSLPNVSMKISGVGYGHGVGMSQYGAKIRAEKGQSYKEILSFYYPGAKITQM